MALSYTWGADRIEVGAVTTTAGLCSGLVRHLVTGGVSQFLEEHIAEGDELKGGLDAEQTADTRSRCKIIQMSLFDGPLSQYGVSSFFKNPWQGLSHTAGPKPNTILSSIPASTQL